MRAAILYASRYGTTEECARRLKDALEGSSPRTDAAASDGRVELVDLQKSRNPDLSGIDTVVIGGPIYAGKPLGVVGRYCERRRSLLQKLNVGLFICCLYEGETARAELTAAYPPWLTARAIVRDVFGGAVTVSRLSVLDRFMMRRVAQTDRDIRTVQPQRIEQFAKTLLAMSYSLTSSRNS